MPSLLHLDEPTHYFSGIGKTILPTPTHILLFDRSRKNKLQQNALQNRSHHRFVLIFNLKTTGHVHINSRSLTFQPGEALLIHPYQFHHFSQLASSSLEWLFCTFELQNQTWLEPLRNRAIPIREDSLKARTQLLSEWHRCSHPVWRGENQNEQLQNALLHLLLSLKQDGQITSTNRPPESAGDLLRTIHRLLSEWRGAPILVADLANQLHLSESYLRVQFKQTAGIPLGSYIQNYRLNRAMALLRTTDLPIATVAEEAGFGSPQAFSRLFKKETGSSPRTYRTQRVE